MSVFESGLESRDSDFAGASIDRRVYARFRWKGTASVRVLPGGPSILGVMVDLSARGCGVELQAAVPEGPGAQVEIELFVRGVSLTRLGIVRNMAFIRGSNREVRVGIEFIEDGSQSTKEFHLSTQALLARLCGDQAGIMTESPFKKALTHVSRWRR